MRGALFQALGVDGSEHPRIIGALQAADFDTIVRAVQVRDPGGGGGAGGPPPLLDPTPAQLSQAGLLGRACRVTVGTQPSAAAAAAAQAAAQTAVKMAGTINQTDDTEVDISDEHAIKIAYKNYHDRIGAFPPAEEELSKEQLSTLWEAFRSGGAPYTDMAVWGPHHHRIQKKIRLRGVKIAPTGEVTSIELTGPADFEDWRACYAVFKVGCIMFEQITPARLDAYEKHLRGFHERYGRQCWALIYQADVRARLELSERLRRIGKDEKESADATSTFHDFDPAKPWEWVWSKLTSDVQFWLREVQEPAVLVLASTASLHQMIDRDAPIMQAPPPPSNAASQRPPALPGAQQQLKRQRSDGGGGGGDPPGGGGSGNNTGRMHKVGPDGLFTHDRKGIELCRSYQTGECTEHDARNNCCRIPRLKHQCGKCLSIDHGANNCALKTDLGECKSDPGLKRHLHSSKGTGRQVKLKIDTETTPDIIIIDSETQTSECYDANSYATDLGKPLPKDLATGLKFLYMFSGPTGRQDGFAQAMRDMGGVCEEWGSINGDEHDLTSEENWRRLKACKSEFHGILMGRDRYGLKHLKPEDQDKVKKGTLLALRAGDMLASSLKDGAPIINEQPHFDPDDPEDTSMYNLDEFQAVRMAEGVSLHDLVQCEYGAEVEKRSSILAINVDLKDAFGKCRHKPQWWRRPSTGEWHLGPHSPLVGKERMILAGEWRRSMILDDMQYHAKFKDAPFLTSSAKSYPAGLNRYFAIKLAMRARQIASNMPKTSTLVRVGYWQNALVNQPSPIGTHRSATQAGIEGRQRVPASTAGTHSSAPPRQQSGARGHRPLGCEDGSIRDEAQSRGSITFSHSLRGDRVGDVKCRECENELYIGGMRHPRQSIGKMQDYGAISEQLRYTIEQHLNANPHIQKVCLDAIGSEADAAGPEADTLDDLATALGSLLGTEDTKGVANDKYDTPIRAGLLAAWARRANDIDGEHVEDWLKHGAPAGIEVDAEDLGIFPKVDTAIGEHALDTLDEHDDEPGFHNYSSVDGDPEAKPEIDRLKTSSYVTTFKSYKEACAWLGAKPNVSKLGMITKVKNGKIKRRLILDCKQSGVNATARQRQRIVLPRLSDVIDDALYLLRECQHEPEQNLEWLVLDFTDWFYNIPLRHCERRHFVAYYGGEFIIFLTMAQGSVNAPLVCGRVAALVARLTQSMFWATEVRHHIYVDDPIIAARGLQQQRDRYFAIIILAWRTLGLKLAFKKAERGQEVDWIGAHLTCKTLPEPAIEVTAKQDIVDEVRHMVTDMRSSNVAPIKDVQSLVGKANHIAGMIEAWRPFLQDMWSTIAAHKRGETSNAPRQCIWTKQIAQALEWIHAFQAGSLGTLSRVYRVRAYFGYCKRVAIVTDASPWGLGGYPMIEDVAKAYFTSPLTQADADVLRAPLGEAAGQQIWEALAMLVALRVWKQVWLQQGIRLAATADSISTLTLLLNFRARTASYSLGVICREMALEFGDCACKPKAYVHLPGIANDVADELSRRAQPGHQARHPIALEGATEFHVAPRALSFFRALPSASQLQRTGAG
ncbi:unnamed protein product [Prorocentrum cordatum]|uniref:Reverse transcriptase domain-containing protein n=1 Tax=Prorocentrum cordatum TaxID=2364126 RepID=A0ABN9X2M0_9DINO|nr:unnamed protein product [Polarella glacialis]